VFSGETPELDTCEPDCTLVSECSASGGCNTSVGCSGGGANGLTCDATTRICK
jgi:hypothetical protein